MGNNGGIDFHYINKYVEALYCLYFIQADHYAAMEVGFGTTPTGLRIIITDMDIHGIGALLTIQLRPSLSLNPTSSLNASRANLVLKAKTASRSSPLSKLYREYSTI